MVKLDVRTAPVLVVGKIRCLRGLAELMMEAGAPPAGVQNVVNGDKEAVDVIIKLPEYLAGGADGFASLISHTMSGYGKKQGKRVQAMGGAKNHGIILPDADMQQAVQDITGAVGGSAGERCMALTVVAVGNETGDRFVEAMTDELGKLNVGISTDSAADYGPVVTAAHKQRIEDYIQMGVDEGAKLVVDGRNFSLQGYEKGFYVGPTLFDEVKPTMQSYQDEIFGPVLQVLREDSFEGALEPSKHQYGNGVAIFTRSGGAAREFAQRVNVGMVGINVPILVPVAYHSFGGWKRSAFGDANQHGMEGVRFYTQTKIVTQRWPDGETQSAAFNIPVME